MFGQPRYSEESPAYQALLRATDITFADFHAGGAWGRKVVGAQAPWQMRVPGRSYRVYVLRSVGVLVPKASTCRIPQT